MSNSSVVKKGACMLALTLAAIAAQPADAFTRHHHPLRLTAHGKKIAKASPSQIPVLDSDLCRQSVSTQFAMLQVHAQQGMQYSTGAGVTVAVLDGGFDLRHEAVVNRILANDVDMLDFDGDSQDLGDGIDNDLDGYTDWVVGHGTFVSSLILAVAPDAMILPIRVLDDEGWGTEASVAAGVNYAVAHGAKVINLSLVVPDASHTLRNALRAAADAGCVVAGAAGNEPDVWYDDPMLAGRILCTGAVDSQDTLLPWSVTGSLVDLYAPGEMVVGALGGAIPNSYARWSGTSFAVPFTSAAAALLASHNPTWTQQMIVDRIRTTCDPAVGVIPADHGRVNIGAALQP